MEVSIPCICPPDGARHPEGDTVVLRDTLGFVPTQTARNAVSLARQDARERGDIALDAAEALAILTEQYVLLGVESWTLVGDDGKPLPVNRTTLRAFLLENEAAEEAASLIADEADGLYSGKVMLPLLVRASNSSRSTPTAPATSPTIGKSQEPTALSSRSSISTTPTDGTATTSKPRAGGSSSSRSSRSAA